MHYLLCNIPQEVKATQNSDIPFSRSVVPTLTTDVTIVNLVTQRELKKRGKYNKLWEPQIPKMGIMLLETSLRVLPATFLKF